MWAALRISAHGASLTEAAHAAGFADSAHLTRVFRATFGLPSVTFSTQFIGADIAGPLLWAFHTTLIDSNIAGHSRNGMDRPTSRL